MLFKKKFTGRLISYALLLLLGGLLSGGCASLQTNVASVARGAETEEAFYTLPKEMLLNGSRKRLSKEHQSIPDVSNRTVNKWLSYFQGRGRKHMKLYLSRLPRYEKWMQTILREHSLPEDLIYISLIESGFSPTAHSHAQAVGYWQFIRRTALWYSLEVTPYVDERKDPLLSTVAASKYFLDLYHQYGDWYLAMAAYNSGGSRVNRALRRARRAKRTQDFWGASPYLPRETRNYVPKFIAARRIAKNQEKYGFPKGSYKPQAPISWASILVPHPISLLELSKQLNIPFKELHLRLNPSYRSDLVPVSKGEEVEIRVPVSLAERASASLALCRATEPKLAIKNHFYHKVRPGETLSHIARKYRTSVRRLTLLNRLRRNSILRIGKVLKVPQRGVRVRNYVEYDVPVRAGSTSVASKGKRARSKSQKSQVLLAKYHTVKSGESLYSISKDYKVSLKKLLQINGLNTSSKIYPGDNIKLMRAPKGYSTNSTRPYKVRRGDSLTSIAKKFKVSVGQIAKANRMNRRASIYPNQRLKIPASNPRRPSGSKAKYDLSTVRPIKYHKVLRGQNLYQIAKRYGMSIQQLKKLNNLVNDKILVGQKLRIIY